MVEVVKPAGMDSTGTEVVMMPVGALAEVSMAVTGQTVVAIGTTMVVTWPILPGQSVTSGAQLVMVETVVV